jgi:hypothetical protein
MFKKYLPLLFLIGCPFFLACPKDIPNKGSQSIVIDFGKISDQNIVKRSVEVDKELVNVVAGCDCVRARISLKKKNRKNISVLDLEFSPAGYSGEVEQNIFLEDKKSQRIKVQIRAQVEAVKKVK